MELRDLRYFLVVVEHQNLGRAAETLDLSSTALGKSLRRLEKSVGAKLVQRTAKGIALTAVGTALLSRIGPLQGVLNDVRHEATDLAQGRAGHIHVGLRPGAAENLVAFAWTALSKESPKITLKASVNIAPTLNHWLLNGEVDFCVTGRLAFSSPEFVHEHLSNDPYVVFASAQHRLARRKQVTIDDLAQERWAAANGIGHVHWQSVIRAFQKKGLPPITVALDTNSELIRNSAVAFSNYLSICSRQFFQHARQNLPLVELPFKGLDHLRPMSIIYRKGAYLSPAAQRLITILKAQAKETPSGGRVARAK